jgi:hypothetical protein
LSNLQGLKLSVNIDLQLHEHLIKKIEKSQNIKQLTVFAKILYLSNSNAEFEIFSAILDQIIHFLNENIRSQGSYEIEVLFHLEIKIFRKQITPDILQKFIQITKRCLKSSIYDKYVLGLKLLILLLKTYPDSESSFSESMFLPEILSFDFQSQFSEYLQNIFIYFSQHNFISKEDFEKIFKILFSLHPTEHSSYFHLILSLLTNSNSPYTEMFVSLIESNQTAPSREFFRFIRDLILHFSKSQDKVEFIPQLKKILSSHSEGKNSKMILDLLSEVSLSGVSYEDIIQNFNLYSQSFSKSPSSTDVQNQLQALLQNPIPKIQPHLEPIFMTILNSLGEKNSISNSFYNILRSVLIVQKYELSQEQKDNLISKCLLRKFPFDFYDQLISNQIISLAFLSSQISHVFDSRSIKGYEKLLLHIVASPDRIHFATDDEITFFSYKKLPFYEDNILWAFIENTQICIHLAHFYASNEQSSISDEKMITTFLNQWLEYFTKELQQFFFFLLSIFIQEIEYPIDITKFTVQRHLRFDPEYLINVFLKTHPNFHWEVPPDLHVSALFLLICRSLKLNYEQYKLSHSNYTLSMNSKIEEFLGEEDNEVYFSITQKPCPWQLKIRSHIPSCIISQNSKIISLLQEGLKNSLKEGLDVLNLLPDIIEYAQKMSQLVQSKIK